MNVGIGYCKSSDTGRCQREPRTRSCKHADIRAQVRLDGASPTTEAELAVISESIEIKVLIVDFLIFPVEADRLDRFVEL